MNIEDEEDMGVFLFVILFIIVLVFLFSIIHNKDEYASTSQKNVISKPKENGNKKVNYDDENELKESFYNLRDAILDGKDCHELIKPKVVEGALIVSHRMMTTMKPAVVHETDFDYLKNVNSNKNFCSLSLFKLETNSSSACRVGLVMVKDGKIKKEIQEDFKPYRLSKKKQKDLGEEKIEYLMSLPEFPEVWDKIKDCFESQIVVVYDLGYEHGALGYLFDKYNIEYRPLTFIFAVGKTQQRLQHYLKENNIEIENDECLLLSKLFASIELDEKLIRDDFSMLKKKMYRKL